MVKFGKEFRRNQIELFKNKYINYKGLKQIIKKNISFSSQNIKQNQSPLPDETTKDNIINEFTSLLDKEIKKIYICYIQNERKLYLQINSHLHMRSTYDTFSIKDINKEISELFEIAQYSFSIVDYVYINLMALKKILKKFDKNYKIHFGTTTINYMSSKLEEKDADLQYVLKFKVIDEVGTLLEDLLEELSEKNLNLKLNNYHIQKKDKNSQNNDEILSNMLLGSTSFDNSGSETEPNINNIPQDINLLNIVFESNIKIIDSIIKKIKEIDDNLHKLKKTFKEWNNIIKHAIDDNISEGNTKNKAFDTTSLGSLPISSNSQITSQSRTNIILISLMTFLISLHEIAVYPNIYDTYKIETLFSNIEYSSVIVGIHFISYLISTFYLSFWIKRSYKKPILFNIFIVLISLIGYIFFGTGIFRNKLSGFHKNGYRIMLSCRFLFGFGLSKGLIKWTIANNTPKKLIKKYIIRIKIIQYLGSIVSVLFSFLVNKYFFNDSEGIFNEYNLMSFISFIGLIILMGIILIKFEDPISQNRLGSVGELMTRNSSVGCINDDSKRGSSVEIADIESRMSQLNDSSHFSDTNLVAKSIEQISWKEKMTSRYVYQSFIIIQILNFISHFLLYQSLILVPAYIYLCIPNKTYYSFCAIGILISIGIQFIIYLIFIRFLSRVNNTITILICFPLVLILISSFCIYSIVTTRISKVLFSEDAFALGPIFGFVLFYSIISSSVKHLFSKIIPYDFVIKEHIKAETAFNIVMNISSFLGSISISLGYFTILSNYPYTMFLILGIIYFIFSLTGFILLLIFRKLMRDKPIVRLLRGKAVRKFKMEEL